MPPNIFHLGNCLQPIITEERAEQEAAEAFGLTLDQTDFDPTDLKHRARDVSGALNTFDFVALTRAEYWRIYTQDEVSRRVFYAWALKAQAVVNEIGLEASRKNLSSNFKAREP